MLAFSQQITAAVKDELSDAGITFNELRNTPDALESMQNRLFDIVSGNMKLAPCSGAFCFLKTTVNDALPDKSYNGLYLKFANLYAENTIHNDVCLFVDFLLSHEKKTSISIVHGSWKHKRGYSRKSTERCPAKARTSPAPSFLHPFINCLDTWESVRFLCIPVLDSGGNTIGVCGFEISSLYFSLSHKTMGSDQAHIFCALLTEDSGLLCRADRRESIWLFPTN